MNCLSWAKIKDIADQMPKLIKQTDYYPFVIVHVGTNDTAINTTASIKADYDALRRRLKGMGGTGGIHFDPSHQRKRNVMRTEDNCVDSTNRSNLDCGATG